MKLPTSILLAAMLAAGCATQAISRAGQGDPGRLILNSAVTIPPEAATLRLQYGRPTAYNAVQEQDPFCVLEVNTVSRRPQIIQPRSFRITRVSRSIDSIAGIPVPRVVPAVFRGKGGGPSQIYYKTRFQLEDADRSVRALTCMSDQNMPGTAPFMRHLTFVEMQQALGRIMTLELHDRI
jgi:hypothetical protein